MSGEVSREESNERDPRRMRRGKSALLLQVLEQNSRDAAARRQSSAEAPSESREELETESQIANLRLEIFLREHDATGALKGERLGRDLAKELRGRGFERDEQGELPVLPEDERNHLLMVHMGELDRLNASGDHSLGDHGLRLTAEYVESVVREVLGRDPSRKDERRLADGYDVYRRSGNDFVVNLRDVDAVSAEEIRRRLAQDAVDVSSVRAGEDPIPVAASRISRADGIALMNRLDAKPEAAGLSDQRVLITAMLEKLQTLNDISKIEMRTQRLLDKIRESQSSSSDESAARDLYDKFLRKSLGDVFRSPDATDPADYDAFRRLVTDHRVLEVPHSNEWTHLVTERAMDDAFRALSSRRAVGRSIEQALASAVAKDVLARDEQIGTVTEDEDEGRISTPEFQLPKDTRGKAKLKQLESSAQEAATGTSPLTAERIRLEGDLERAKRDERTGLYGRGVYYETMERAMAEGRPVATIAIDMAFLKYFDKEGGPETGNLAIQKAAELLDEVAAEYQSQGIEVEAYRTGGDEFAFTVVGGDERVMNEILRSLRKGERSSGRVPATAGATSRYHSEGLQFNYGVRQAKDAASFRSELEGLGIDLKSEDGPEAATEAVEYLARLADKEVEIQKGVNRMMMLLKRELSGDDTSTLRQYSQKAIFGAAGEAKLAQLQSQVAFESNRTVALGQARGEITRFVVDQLDKKNEAVADFESSLDKRMEDAVRIRFFESRISELEEEVESLRAALATERSDRETLGHAVRAAEAEKQAIVDLRERIGKPKLPEPERRRIQTAA